MLIIRDAQMQALQSALDADFVVWMARRLRTTCPDATRGIDDAELQRRSLVGLARARAHGLVEPDDVAAFIVLMVRYAPRFDEHPVIRAELSRALARGRSAAADPPRTSLLLLPQRVPPAVWAEVRAAYEERHWDFART